MEAEPITRQHLVATQVHLPDPDDTLRAPKIYTAAGSALLHPGWLLEHVGYTVAFAAEHCRRAGAAGEATVTTVVQHHDDDFHAVAISTRYVAGGFALDDPASRMGRRPRDVPAATAPIAIPAAGDGRGLVIAVRSALLPLLHGYGADDMPMLRDDGSVDLSWCDPRLKRGVERWVRHIGAPTV